MGSLSMYFTVLYLSFTTFFFAKKQKKMSSRKLLSNLKSYMFELKVALIFLPMKDLQSENLIYYKRY
jgi:hypothetical protein